MCQKDQKEELEEFSNKLSIRFEEKCQYLLSEAKKKSKKT